MTNISTQTESSFDKELQAFKEVVLKDVRNEINEEEKQYLLQNLDLWQYVLQTTRRDVEFQLSSQKSKDKISFYELMQSHPTQDQIIEYNKKKDKWKMGAIRFLSAIEKKMLYVKIIIKNNTKDNFNV
jgi:hypothetical protein